MTLVSRLEARVGGERLSIRVVASPAGAACRGSVFVPPLIGGSGMQQVGYFRALNLAGWRIATFDYRGQGKSSGRFRIRHSLEDTRAALVRVHAELGGEPLHGLADCYGCIPLLRAAAAEPRAFRSLALFNPIPSLQHVAGPGAVLASYFLPHGSDGRRRLTWRHPLDLRGMLLATNARLFPDIDKSRDHFGILRYERVDAWHAAWEYLATRPLAGVASTLPARLWYGRSDRLLRLVDPGSEQRYLAIWRRHLPRVEAHVLEDVDHYWTGLHPRASALAATFFEQHAAHPTSASRATRPGGTTSSAASRHPAA